MMKTIKSLFMIMIVMLAVVPVAFAEENDSVNSDGDIVVETNDTLIIVEDEEIKVITSEEANILSTEVGAQIRLLQLQKRVEAQTESGQIIIDRIVEVKPEFDTVRLSEIVDELYILIELIEEYDLEQDKETIADDYVGFKKR